MMTRSGHGARISASHRPYEADRPTHVLLRLLGSGLSIVQIFGIRQVGGRVFVGACETVEEKRRVVIKWFFPELWKRRKQTNPSRSNSTATFCPLLYMVPMNPPCLSVLSKAAIVIRVHIQTSSRKGQSRQLTDLDISLHVTGVGPLLTLGPVRLALLSCSSSTRSLDTWTDGHSSDKHMARRHSMDCNPPAKTKVIFLFSLGKNNLNREPEATKSTIA